MKEGIKNWCTRYRWWFLGAFIVGIVLLASLCPDIKDPILVGATLILAFVATWSVEKNIKHSDEERIRDSHRRSLEDIRRWAQDALSAISITRWVAWLEPEARMDLHRKLDDFLVEEIAIKAEAEQFSEVKQFGKELTGSVKAAFDNLLILQLSVLDRAISKTKEEKKENEEKIIKSRGELQNSLTEVLNKAFKIKTELKL